LCDLNRDELDLLYYMLTKRCVSVKHSRALKAIERDLEHLHIDVNQVLRSLDNKGYLGCKKKNPVNYWIEPGRAAKVLRENGYDVPVGHQHRL
jgi:hypothetical protein